MCRFAFYLCAIFALVAFCGGWGWGAVLAGVLWAICFWEMDREMHGRGMK